MKSVNCQSSGASDAHDGFEADFPRQVSFQVELEPLGLGGIPLRVEGGVKLDFATGKPRDAGQRREVSVLA